MIRKKHTNSNNLLNRVLFVIFALLIFRLGTHIPLPGIDGGVLAEITKEGMREIYGAASENNNMGKRSAEALKNTPKKTKNR